MGIKTKTALAATFVGVAAMAAAAFGESGSGTTTGRRASAAPGSTPTAHPSTGPGERRAQARDRRAERRCDRPGARRARRVVHSEMKVKTPNGFALVTIDQGEITKLDGHTITIKRLDGRSVSATATDETRVCRDGNPATFDALKVGDQARMMQIRSERFTGLRRITAATPGSEPAQPSGRPADYSGDGFDEFMGDVY